MESESRSLLNVPITEAERRQSQRRALGESSQRSAAAAPSTQHERDRQFTPQIGRFSSLRHPGERYDDPDRPVQIYDHNSRPSALPDIEEESHFSDHDDEEPIHQPARATTFPPTSAGAYQPVRQPPSPKVGATSSSQISASQFWQPIWLKKLPLALMTALLLALIVGIIVVCHTADSDNGYRLSDPSSHYLWTYIPTLIFVILVALWRQIDFHAKSLMPWKELSLGPLSPFETVLVDYVSEFQVLSFLAAFKRLHRSVLITIIAFLIAKGLTIAATALFVVQSKTFTDGFPTSIISTFDATALDPTILDVGNFPNASVYTFSQNLVNGLGSEVGVAPGYAYIPPVLHSDSEAVPANSTFSAVVDSFVPQITCRAANVTLNGEATIETTDFPYNSTDTPYGSPANITLTINEPEFCSSWPQLTFSGLDPLHYLVPASTLESRSQEIYCGDNSTAGPILLLTMVETSYAQELLTNVTRPEGGDLPIALNTSRSVTRMSNVLCQADYTISQVNVTNNTVLHGAAALTLSPVTKPNNRSLDGLSPANMTTIYNSLLGSNTGLFNAAPDPNFIRTPAFDLLAFTANGKYDALFDTNTLSSAAEQVYLGTMPDFAYKNLVSPVSSSAPQTGPVASITWNEERIFTNWTPVIIVVTGLGIMTLLTVALILFMPEHVVPRDPNTIAAAATTLTRSVELNRLLRKLQSPRNKGIAAALNGYEVGTAIAVEQSDGSKSFKIHVTEGKPQRDVQEIAPNFKFWNPTWASLPVAAATFCLPLIFIAILEVTQHQSDKNQGLFDVPDDRGTVIGSHYVPAFITLVIAAVIGNLNFYISLFSPWANLLKTRARPEHSILTSVLGHSPPSAFITSIRGRYWGAILSTLSTVLAALLTVIISGLFVVGHFDTSGPTRSLSRLDDFNVSRATAYTVDNDGGAGAMLNLIEHNSSFPAFTADEYAFPRMSLLNFNGDFEPGSKLVGPMHVTLPAFRGNLSCEGPTAYDVSTDGSSVQVTASYDVPDSCRNGVGSELDNSTVTFSTEFSPAGGATVFGGRLFDLRFGTNSSQYGHLGEANSSLVADNPPVGCPSLVFVWGNFQLGNNNKSAANVAVCYQKLQTVNVNATLQQNTTDFDQRYPIPMPNDTSVTPQHNPNGTTDVFDFRIQNNLARQLGTYMKDNTNVDSFFQAILNGSIRMDQSTFVEKRELALMGISHTYRLYMAQVVNAMMRESLPSTNNKLTARQQSTLPDARTTVTKSRLVQDKTSKIILQVLLGLSAALIIAGYVLTKIRNVLPCNPCSIAGTMSLLAGSDLCYAPDNGVCECCGKQRRSFRDVHNRPHVETSIHPDDNEHAEDPFQLIRPGAEWMDDKTFARVFGGKTFSLGWWEPTTKKSKKSKANRYGVDYGDEPAGTEGDWYLGKRKNSETFEIFSEQVNQANRGRTRALSDVNERGAYQRAEPSPGVEAYEMRNMAPEIRRASDRERDDEV